MPVPEPITVARKNGMLWLPKPESCAHLWSPELGWTLPQTTRCAAEKEQLPKGKSKSCYQNREGSFVWTDRLAKPAGQYRPAQNPSAWPLWHCFKKCSPFWSFFPRYTIVPTLSLLTCSSVFPVVHLLCPCPLKFQLHLENSHSFLKLPSDIPSFRKFLYIHSNFYVLLFLSWGTVIFLLLSFPSWIINYLTVKS